MVIEHFHFLSDSWLDRFRKEGTWYNNLQRAESVNKVLENHRSKEKVIITLVRDPIARDVSAVFQSWDTIFKTNDFNSINSEQIVEQLSKSPFNQTENWFNTEFKEYTGIDILKLPFNKDDGYAVYRAGKYRLLVLKLERLSDCYREAISDLLGTKNNVLGSYNLTSNKTGAPVHKKVKDSFALPGNRLDEIYSSDFLRHFYTDQELEHFKMKWSKDNE